MPSRWTGPSRRTDLLNGWQYQTAVKAYGSGDIDTVFGGKPISTAPWPKSGRTKGVPAHRRTLINETLSAPPVLEDVDPRPLHATQSSVVREHANYYMGEGYEDTGRTAADQDQVGNQYPVVYARPNGSWDILSGHHRALVALVKGQALRARVIRDPGNTS